MSKVELPQWLMNELPKYTKPSVISYDDNTQKYIVTKTNGNTAEFDDLRSAYRSITSKYKKLDDSLPEKKNNKHGYISLKQDDGYSSVIFEKTYETDMEFLLNRYKDFLKTAKKYRKDSQNIPLAYDFVNSHPMFWIKVDEKENRTFHWETENALTYMSIYPFQNKKDSVKWRIECGAHMTERDEHTPAFGRMKYYDPRLTAEAKTFDKAIVKLAKHIDELFDTDGTEKENVKRKKTKDEKTLEKLFKNISKDMNALDKDMSNDSTESVSTK